MNIDAMLKMPPDPEEFFVYRIRRKSDGKYSTGTSSPKWTKNGKFFPNYQALQSHLLWFLAGPSYHDYERDRMITDRKRKPNPEHYTLEIYCSTLKEVKQLVDVIP